MNTSTQIVIFIGEIILLFFLSRLTLQKMYPVLKKTIKKDSYIVFLVSLFYMPGTIVHELSHYIVALILSMNPREMSLFPLIEGKKVRLGHVLYEKNPRDFIRPIIVGIAPFIGGLISLWILIQSKLFPGGVWWQTILFGYLVIAITANMFSSKQDLIDVGYLIPVVLLTAFLFYIFPIRIPMSFIEQLSTHILYFIQTIQPPLLFSLGIHAILVLLLIKFK